MSPDQVARNQTLTLWTKLLVAQYGRNQVIAALAQADGAEFETIEREVEAVRQSKLSRRRTPPKTLTELLEPLKLDSKMHALVTEIGSAYQNKRFLGELWRVRRFLESHGVEADKLRSRAAALPIVIGVLSEMPITELTEIAAQSNGQTRGDLGIIADQILGTDGVSSRPVAANYPRDSG